MLAKGTAKYKNLSLQQQFLNLKSCLLSKNGKGQLHRKYFYWEFDVILSPLSQIYRVLIIFHINSTPKIYVLNNDVLEVSKNREIPHLYDKKKVQLCLYYPSYNEWNKTMPLCNTIVSWTHLWLSYYEEWLYSGEWKGGGKHPEPTTNENKKLSPLQKILNKPTKKNKYDLTKNEIENIYQNRKNEYKKIQYPKQIKQKFENRYSQIVKIEKKVKI